MTFGERIRTLRLESGLTGEEFGKNLNVAKNTVSNWENNKRVPSKEVIVLIADYFKTTTDYLLCNTDIKNESGMVEAIKKVLIDKGFTDKPEELEEMREFLRRAMDLYNLKKGKKG